MNPWNSFGANFWARARGGGVVTDFPKLPKTNFPKLRQTNFPDPELNETNFSYATLKFIDTNFTYSCPDEKRA